MSIILVGLNHRTAPVELREKLVLSDSALQGAFADLRSQIGEVNNRQPSPIIDEVVIVSTCNRLEVYASTNDADHGIRFIKQFLATLQNVPIAELMGHLYDHRDDAAIHHLMCVACGLDSMILGETEILGQVVRAYETAHDTSMTGAVLSHLFTQSIHAGKRARTETPISRHTTSVSHAAALLMIEKLNGQSAPHVVIVGAGEMAKLAAQSLKRFDIHNLMFINRTYERGESMANEFGGSVQNWSQLQEALIWADAVICATAAPSIVIDRPTVEAALQQRENRPLVIIDIAVPRDVEATVNDLQRVEVYDIDDLQSVVDTNVELRKAAIPQVEAIIQQEMTRFAEWHQSRQVTPVIKDLREWAQNIADEELGQTLNRLSDADERTRQIVTRMAHRLVNRLLHEPTSRLRVQASEGNGHAYADVVRDLFALNTLDAMEFPQHEIDCEPVKQTEPPTNPYSRRCMLPMGQQL